MTTSINIQELLKNFGAEGKIVGFKNKFYTLWEYKITQNQVSGEYVFDAYFIKNLGLENHLEDLLPFDSSLSGSEIHIKYFEPGTGRALNKLQFKALRFSVNPSSGSLISEYTDVNTLCWKYNNQIVDGKVSQKRQEFELANICNRALELGAKIINNQLYPESMLNGKSFSKNPYRGVHINKCNDLSVLCWKYNNKAVEENRPSEIVNAELELIKNRAIELGAVTLNNWFFDINKDFVKESIETLSALSTNKPFAIKTDSNLSWNGTLKIGLIEFEFDYKYYPGTYYGPEYYLPVDKKGKGKRIKGKEIEIISYEKIDDTKFKVLDWRFKK